MKFGISYILRGSDKVHRFRKTTIADQDEYDQFCELTKTTFKSLPESEAQQWYLKVGGTIVRGSDISMVDYVPLDNIFKRILWMFK